MGFRVSAPAPDTGYNRTTDWPSSGGGAPSTGGGPLSGFFSSTVSPTAGTWHPTIKWLLGFVLAELIVFHLLARHLKI